MDQMVRMMQSMMDAQKSGLGNSNNSGHGRPNERPIEDIPIGAQMAEKPGKVNTIMRSQG